MNQDPETPMPPVGASVGHGLRRIEHYTLYLLNGMAAAGSGGFTDEDIDLAIDTAERLAHRLLERGHIQPHE